MRPLDQHRRGQPLFLAYFWVQLAAWAVLAGVGLALAVHFLWLLWG